MKKKYLISIAIIALSAASCNRLVDFTEIPFVYFPTSSISVAEDAGIIEIPVKAVSDASFTLTFETQDGEKKDASTGLMVPNGKKGVDYDIVDNDAAIIRFNAGETDKVIKVNIVNFAGVLTGNKDFTIRLTGAGNEVSTGGYSYCKVTIVDNDHPLKEIFGEYTATDANGTSWTMTFAAAPDMWDTVYIDGIVPTFAGSYVGKGIRHYMPGAVSDDLSTITLNLGYKLADQYNGHDIIIFGYDGQYIYGSGTVTLQKTADGYKLDGTKGFAAIYENGGYYLAASNATAMAPITLVKK